MKPHNFLCLAFVVLLLLVSVGAAAQEIEPGTWRVSVSRTTIYIGEKYFVNVSGMANHSFELKYVCTTTPNNTFSEYRQTNEMGVASFNTPKRFSEGEEGFYRVTLLVNGIEADRVTIEIVYDEYKALEMRVEDLEDRDSEHDAADARHDQNDAIFDRLYREKWLPALIVAIAFIFWREIRDWYFWWWLYKKRYADWSEKGRGEYMKKVLDFISAGGVEDHRDEYAGFASKSVPKPFTKEDIDPDGKWPTEDMVDMTMDEVMERGQKKKGA